MTTLFALFDADACIGRCDSSCYNATGTKCRCVCGGINHGLGREKALAQTRLFLSGMPHMRQAAHRRPSTGKLIFPLEVQQRQLLPTSE